MNTITRNDAMITTAIPKSGSFSITATNSPITAIIGRNARYPCFGFTPFRSMAHAAKARSANFANSEGWKVKKRRLIHREAPFAVCRIPGTFTRSSSRKAPPRIHAIRRR